LKIVTCKLQLFLTTKNRLNLQMPYDGPPCTYILTDIFVIPSRISYDAFEGRLHTFQLVSRPTCSTTDFIASQTTIQFNPVVLQVVGTHDPTIVPTVASNVVERSVVRQIVSCVGRLSVEGHLEFWGSVTGG
jgi:hypothetical protein